MAIFRAIGLGVLISAATVLSAANHYVTVTADAGPGSLRQLVLDAAPGDVIEFATAVQGQTILLQQSILIDKALHIQGDRGNRVILDGGGVTRLFVVNAPGASVHIKDVVLTGGYATDHGGAIAHLGGDLRVEGVILRGNVVALPTPAQGPPSRGGGGAIYSRDTLIISGSAFELNEARGSLASGGAILIDSASSARLSSNSRVVHNFADDMGGGLAVLAGGYIYLRDMRVDSNAVGFSGGGVALLGGECGMYIGSISGNVAPGEGGGIYVEDGAAVIRRIDIMHNIARGTGGGGVFVRGAGAFVQLNPSTRVNYNVATDSSSIGGGIAVVDSARLRNNDIQVRGNQAFAAGGGIAFVSSNGSYTSRLFGEIDSNRVVGFPGTGGGAYVKTTDEVRVGGRYEGNYARGSGGGIWVDVPELNLVRGSFTGNTCGAAEADAGGGAVYSDGGPIFLRQMTFRANRALAATASGGAILSRSGSITTRDTSTFVDNSCGARGGAICVLDGRFSFARFSFENNHAFAADGRGGAVYCGGDRLNGRHSTMRANAAGARGGAIYTGPAAEVELQVINLIDNLVYGGVGGSVPAGGGVYTAGYSLEVCQSTLSRNAALGSTDPRGGGLVVIGSGTARLGRSTLSGNTTGGPGGGMYTERAAALEDLTVYDNQAERGGGLFVIDSGTTTLSGSILAANHATAAGGRNLSLSDGAGLESGTYNLFGELPSHGVLRSLTDTLVDAPLLGPLADNGGKTWTHRPLPGSPVINRGRPSTGSWDVDQIDQPPAGGRREIGSLEVPLATFFADTDGDGFGDPNATVQAAAAPGGYVGNGTDNCPTRPNPDQTDANNNGIGDACE